MFANIPNSAAESKRNYVRWEEQLPAGERLEAAGTVLLFRERDGGRASLQSP